MKREWVIAIICTIFLGSFVLPHDVYGAASLLGQFSAAYRVRGPLAHSMRGIRRLAELPHGGRGLP